MAAPPPAEPRRRVAGVEYGRAPARTPGYGAVRVVRSPRYPASPPISQGRGRAGVASVLGRGNRILGLVGRYLGWADRRGPACLRSALAQLGGSNRTSRC